MTATTPPMLLNQVKDLWYRDNSRPWLRMWKSGVTKARVYPTFVLSRELVLRWSWEVSLSCYPNPSIRVYESSGHEETLDEAVHSASLAYIELYNKREAHRREDKPVNDRVERELEEWCNKHGA